MEHENSLPSTPPRLQDIISLSNQQIADIYAVLGELSEALDWAPIVLSQDGQVVAYAGVEDEGVAEGLSRNAAQFWREGATRNAREYVSFEEKNYGEPDQYNNLMLHSVHVRAALTISIGIEFPSSLTKIRQHTVRAKAAIQRIVLTG